MVTPEDVSDFFDNPEAVEISEEFKAATPFNSPEGNPATIPVKSYKYTDKNSKQSESDSESD